MSTSTPLSTTAVDVTERLARRSLALSQLTNSPAPVVAPIVTTASRPSTASLVLGVPRPTATPTRPEQDEEEDHDIDSDEEEDAEEEDEDEEEHMSLAQVVAEWSVENVCLWLHEDVGVPEVVVCNKTCNSSLHASLCRCYSLVFNSDNAVGICY